MENLFAIQCEFPLLLFLHSILQKSDEPKLAAKFITKHYASRFDGGGFCFVKPTGTDNGFKLFDICISKLGKSGIMGKKITANQVYHCIFALGG